MNPISASQMGIARVPRCPDVQWSGRFQRENCARHRTQSCDSRLRYFELSGGILPQKGLLIAVRQGMRDLGVWAHLLGSAACDWEQIACARFEAMKR